MSALDEGWALQHSGAVRDESDPGAPLGSARSIAPLGAFYFFSLGSLGLYGPYFPLWLEAHGFRGSTMSAIAALVPALSLVAPPVVGLLADVRGARGGLLSAASALSCSAMFALALAEAFGAARAFPVVFGAALVFAACRSPQILVADRIAFEQGGDYGRRRVWGSIGYVVTAALFGELSTPDAQRWLPAAMGLVLLGAALASFGLPRGGAAAASVGVSRAGRAIQKPRFVGFLVCSTLFAAGHSSYDLCGSLWFRDLGASADVIGALWAAGVLAEIALIRYAAPLLARARPEAWLAAAYAVGALRWLGMAWLRSPLLAFVLQPLHAVTFGVVWLSSLALLRDTVEPAALGSAQGLMMAASALGSVLGMFVWGPLYAAQGGAVVFVTAASLALGALLVAFGFSYRSGGASERATVA